MGRERLSFSRVAAAAPLLFLLHVVEEYPRLIPWLNSLLRQDITTAEFFALNAFAFMMLAGLTAFAVIDPGPVSALLFLTLVSVMMAWNALFHVLATLKLGAYAPGVITSVALYVPYTVLVTRAAWRERLARIGALGTACVVGAGTMGVHGFLILFRGGRLF